MQWVNHSILEVLIYIQVVNLKNISANYLNNKLHKSNQQIKHKTGKIIIANATDKFSMLYLFSEKYVSIFSSVTLHTVQRCHNFYSTITQLSFVQGFVFHIIWDDCKPGQVTQCRWLPWYKTANMKVHYKTFHILFKCMQNTQFNIL